jgi:hypothetical protein
MGFVVRKVALGLGFSQYFGFPANSHSASCSIITYHPITGVTVVLIPRASSKLSSDCVTIDGVWISDSIY